MVDSMSRPPVCQEKVDPGSKDPSRRAVSMSGCHEGQASTSVCSPHSTSIGASITALWRELTGACWSMSFGIMGFSLRRAGRVSVRLPCLSVSGPEAATRVSLEPRRGPRPMRAGRPDGWQRKNSEGENNILHNRRIRPAQRGRDDTEAIKVRTQPRGERVRHYEGPSDGENPYDPPPPARPEDGAASTNYRLRHLRTPPRNRRLFV